MAILYRGPDSSATPGTYHVVRVGADDAWMAGAAETADAAPAIAWGPERFQTTFRAAASPEALLLRWDCRDERPWHTLTSRDAPLWNEEVVEIFLDPTGTGRDYAEIEINPANVVCDLRIRGASPALVGEIAWDFDGLTTHVFAWRSAEAGPDGWTAVARLPWPGFRALSPEAASLVPPAPGSEWRFNVFRIKRPGGPADPERDAIYAAWSVPDGPTFHVPAVFGTMVFS